MVIPTFNSARTISRCLESIQHQTVKPAQVLVIDRFSRDETVGLCRKLGAAVISEDENRSRSRNIGMENATADGLLFVDSDMLLQETLVEDCRSALEHFGALVIPEISIGTGFWALCKSLERTTHSGNEMIEAPRCFRKKSLLSLGGYDPVLEAGEDWDLRNRMKEAGVAIGRISSIIFHDEGQVTLPNLLKKKYYYGKKMRGYITKYPRTTLKQVNPFVRTLGPGLSLLPKHPKHAAGVMILKTLEFGVASIAMMTSSQNSVR